MAVVRPSLQELGSLPTPLNCGERRVIGALARLTDDWTIYVQPRVGPDMPDVVAVHDRFGVCAIEVKDWSRSGYRQADDGSIEYRTSDGWHRSTELPRYQAHRYRSTIYDSFFAAPTDSRDPTPAVRSVVVLPQYSTEDARKLLRRIAVTTQEHHVGVWGGDALTCDVERMLIGIGCPRPSAESLTRLRRHLSESQLLAELRTPAKLSPDARNIESNPNKARIRRVRGPAGCGKSFGLAARAARLAADGKTVLVVAFNVTLINYLRTLVNARCKEYGANPTLVTCSSFHAFCHRILDDARVQGLELPKVDEVKRWDAQVRAAEHALVAGIGHRYGAVLVDEGQDFTLDWWNLLRHQVVEPGGEMLLVADPTQDVYDRRSWTDEGAMLGAGFAGPWTELKGSYRMPSDLVPITNSFAERYLRGDRIESEVPSDAAEVVGHRGTTRRRWRNIDRPVDLGREVGLEVVRLLADVDGLSPRDVVFLCEDHRSGLAAVREIERAGYTVHHIFSTHEHEQQIRKRRFWPDADGVKGCTIHSFKGWESPVLVMGIGRTPESRRLAYVAMTRLTGRGVEDVGHLSVINSDLQIAGFQSTFELWAPPRAEMRLA